MDLNFSNRPGAQGYILLHVFVGPVIAVVAMFTISIVTNASFDPTSFKFSPAPVWEIAYVLLGIILAAWFIGFIPTILYTSAMLLLHRVMGTTIVWMLLTPFVGWLAGFLPLVLLTGTDPKAFTIGASMSTIGSAAALGCLAIAWWKGIYPVRIKPAK